MTDGAHNRGLVIPWPLLAVMVTLALAIVPGGIWIVSNVRPDDQARIIDKLEAIEMRLGALTVAVAEFKVEAGGERRRIEQIERQVERLDRRTEHLPWVPPGRMPSREQKFPYLPPASERRGYA